MNTKGIHRGIHRGIHICSPNRREEKGKEPLSFTFSSRKDEKEKKIGVQGEEEEERNEVMHIKSVSELTEDDYTQYKTECHKRDNGDIDTIPKLTLKEKTDKTISLEHNDEKIFFKSWNLLREKGYAIYAPDKGGILSVMAYTEKDGLFYVPIVLELLPEKK